MTPHDLARELLASAAKDQVAAAKYADDADVSNEIVGFHVQQAAEKMLKAVLAAAGAAFPRTHDLTLLIDLLAASGIALPAGLNAVRQFTPFAVDYRYPPPPPAPVTLDRAEAVGLVERLRAWAEAELKRLAPAPPMQPDASDTSGGSDP